MTESFINVYSNGKLGGAHPTRDEADAIAIIDDGAIKAVYRLRVKLKKQKRSLLNE